jgi:hypothetical protein
MEKLNEEIRQNKLRRALEIPETKNKKVEKGT